ncbi:hypothetical protein AgCh_004193 [Apium graveolens]
MEHLIIHLPYEARVGGPVQYWWMYPFERLMGMLKRAVKNRACVEGRAYGKGKWIFLSETYLHAAHTYILLNCEEIDEFMRLYDDELKALTEGSTLPVNVQSLAMGPDMDQVSRNGYKVNGYEFHTKAYGRGKRTTNTGLCILEKRIRVDRHGIVDIDVHKSAYSNEPFVLPTQIKQVYYTPSPRKRRDMTPSDLQAVIHTPARRREEVVNGEFYQEEMLRRLDVINVDVINGKRVVFV